MAAARNTVSRLWPHYPRLAISDMSGKPVQRADTALHDKDAVIRRSAAITLGELKAHSALGDLKQALNDTPEVSFAAAKALTRLGDTSGRDVMVAVLAGERKDAPGIFTNAMRDAKDRLHHPEGLFPDGRGRCRRFHVRAGLHGHTRGERYNRSQE